MDYLAIYNRLCLKAKSKNRKRRMGVYYELHHIIPKCLGGLGKYDIAHPNLVLLTAKEHYMAHRLLCMIYPDNMHIKYALWCMVNGHGTKNRYATSAKIYERLRSDHAEFLSSIYTGIQKPVRSDEHKKNISMALKGRKMSEDVKLKLKGRVPPNKGIKLSDAERERRSAKAHETLKSKGPRIISDETRNKLSAASKGRPAWNKGKTLSKPRSEETRARLSASGKEAWARKKSAKSKSAPVDAE